MKTVAADTDGRIASIAKSVAIGACAALCCWILIRTTREPDNLSTLWIAVSVLVGMLASVLVERRLLARGLRESELRQRMLADNYRAETERAIAEHQRRLHAITDNLPAFVLHVDVDEVYTFANAPTYTGMGFGQSAIIGRSIRDVVGETIYAEIKPQIDRALHGESVSFEIERDFGGEHLYYQSTYVPEVDADGKVVGFYVMSSDISQLKRTEHELMLLARFDGLTGIANRLHFNESIELALARHRRNDRPLALLYLDIDYFKRINDSFGHAVGDGVLIEFARRLKNSIRVTDFVARLGGDEFVALVEDVDAPEMPEIIAHKVIAAMQEPILIDGHELHVTASIGIAFCSRIAVNRDKLLHAADEALYAAKAAGRNACRTALIEDPGLKIQSGTS